MLKRGPFVAALVVAAALVPAASANRSHTVNLALVPLPKSALGPAASSFSLSHDSGPVSNANAASHTADATPRTFKKLGRVHGYGLELRQRVHRGCGHHGRAHEHRGVQDIRRRQARTRLLAERGRRARQAEQSRLLGHERRRPAAGPGGQDEPLRPPHELQRGEHRSRGGDRRAGRRRPLRPGRHRHGR